MATNDPILAASPPEPRLRPDSPLGPDLKEDSSQFWANLEPNLPELNFSPAMDTNHVYDSIGQSAITKDNISPCEDVPVDPQQCIPLKRASALVPKTQIRGLDLFAPLVTIEKSDLLKADSEKEPELPAHLFTPLMANLEDSGDDVLVKPILAEADPSILGQLKRDLVITAVNEGVTPEELLAPSPPITELLADAPVKKILAESERAILAGRPVLMDDDEDSQAAIDIPSDLLFPASADKSRRPVTARKSPPTVAEPPSLDSEDEPYHDDSDDEDFVPRKPRSRGRPRRTRKRTANDSSSSRSKECKKRKLYECAPFKDPVKEKKRLDAINAKQNRDRKKKEKMALVKQMDLLRQENEAIKEREQALTQRALKAEKTCEALVKLLIRNNMGHLVNINGQSIVSKAMSAK